MLDGDKWPVSRSDRFTPGNHSQVGLRSTNWITCWSGCVADERKSDWPSLPEHKICGIQGTEAG